MSTRKANEVKADRMRQLTGRLGAGSGRLLVLGALFILVVLPVGIIIYASFLSVPPRPGSTGGTFTFQYYRELASSRTLRAIGNSLKVGIGGMLGAVTLGGLLAWLATRSNMPGRRLAAAAGLVPLFIPSLVGALAYDLLTAPHSGYLTILLREFGLSWSISAASTSGITFVLAIFYAPYAYMFLMSAFSLMNPELEDAAAVHGASTLQVMREVTFPLAQPALFGAMITSFVLVIENFTVPMILGANAGVDTIPSLIYIYMLGPTPRHNLAATLGMVLMILMFLSLWLQNRVMRGREFHSVSGKGFRPARVDLGRFRWPALALVIIYFVFAAVVPLSVLVIAMLRNHSFVRDLADFLDPAQYGLSHIIAAFQSPALLESSKNSLIVGFGAALFGVMFVFVVSYLVNRTRMRGRGLIESITMAPLAIPSLLVGMGFLWTWLYLPIKLYGTLSIMALAYIARFLPQGFRGISSSIRQIHPDLEDVARVSGASRLRSITYVLVPLMRPGITATAILLFVLAVRELSTSIFLFTAQTRVLSVLIFQQWEGGRWPIMATMSLSLAIVLGVIALVGQRLGRGRSEG